jgi:predicted transcriptional regulator
MSLEVSRETEARLIAAARAEGLSVEAFVERLMEEREELAGATDRSYSHSTPLSREELQAKIERGFAQSERGEVVDGEAFVGELLAEMNAMPRNLK